MLYLGVANPLWHEALLRPRLDATHGNVVAPPADADLARGTFRSAAHEASSHVASLTTTPSRSARQLPARIHLPTSRHTAHIGRRAAMQSQFTRLRAQGSLPSKYHW